MYGNKFQGFVDKKDLRKKNLGQGRRIKCEFCHRLVYVHKKANVKMVMAGHRRVFSCFAQVVVQPKKDSQSMYQETYTQLPDADVFENSQYNYLDVGDSDTFENDEEDWDLDELFFVNDKTCEEIQLCSDDSLPFQRDLILGTVQIEQLKGAGEKVTLQECKTSMAILDHQNYLSERFDYALTTPNFMNTRSPKGSNGKKILPIDQIEMQELATDLKLSTPQTQKLIDYQFKLFQRHGIDIQLHKTALGLKQASSRYVLEERDITVHGLCLPTQFFGVYEDESKLTKWKSIKFCLFNIVKELAKALSDIDPSDFIEEYEEANNDSGRILTHFGTGEFMRKLSLDLKNYVSVDDTIKKIPLIISVSTDDTTVGNWRKISEKPLYCSILNAKGKSYKLIFLGYGPVRMPYTNKQLNDMLMNRGYEVKSHRVHIIKNLKNTALQYFIKLAFESVTTFGKNVFRFRLGSGNSSKLKCE